MRAILYLSAPALALFVLAPLSVAVAISLNPDNTEVLATMGNWQMLSPSRIGLDNFVDVWTDPFHPYARYWFNTAFITAAVICASLLINSALAFALAWSQLRWRRYVIAAVIALIAIPAEALMLPLLLLLSRAGMLDGYAVQIVPFIANALFVFLFYQFFRRMPRALIDAARVDGLSLARIYWHIGLPAVAPVCASVAILQFLATWNSYLWPAMVTRSAEVRPLSLAMAAYFDSEQTAWGNVMAFAVSMIIPAIVLFVVAQKSFVAAVTASSIKGR